MRAKFFISMVSDLKDSAGTKYGEDVLAHAVYSSENNTEDNQFSNATPAGSLTMVVSNPNAFGFLEEGQKYYLDFTKAEK